MILVKFLITLDKMKNLLFPPYEENIEKLTNLIYQILL